MWKWVHEILEMRSAEAERQRQHELDLRICTSCEFLKDELTRAHSREKELIRFLTSKPETEGEKPYETSVPMIQTRKPWDVKRQELEKKHSIQPVKVVTEDTLEKELQEARNAK